MTEIFVHTFPGSAGTLYIFSTVRVAYNTQHAERHWSNETFGNNSLDSSTRRRPEIHRI